MNKQEAIERINNESWEYWGYIPESVIETETVRNIIYHIDEPQKAVIQKFVAEWIEYCKEQGITLLGAFEPVSEHVVGLAQTFKGSVYKCTAWASHNQEIFARAWLDGYEIEQEKLYTVKMKNAYHRDFGFNEMYGNYSFYNREDTDAGICFEFTKQELEQAGFGSVFDNDMFEVEVVE